MQNQLPAVSGHDPHKAHSASITTMISGMWANRGLIAQMVVREVAGRYKGSVMGLAWSFLNPLFMLAIYTFVFSTVFKARWGTNSESRVDFAIILFVGLIIHGLFAECVTRAPTLVVSNANYVKKVVFPLEVLPTVALCSALFHAVISMLVLIAAIVFSGNAIHPTVLLWPVLILPTAMATLGFSWLLASLGVYLRDVGQVATIFTSALLFLSPVFFPMSAMPEEYRAVMSINPLTTAIEQMRAAVIWGQGPDWGHFLVQVAVGFGLAWLGYWWFQRTRKGFADVL